MCIYIYICIYIYMNTGISMHLKQRHSNVCAYVPKASTCMSDWSNPARSNANCSMCAGVQTSACVHVCKHQRVCRCANISVCTCVQTSACVQVCKLQRVCRCANISMCAGVQTSACVHVCKHQRVCRCANISMCFCL